MKFLFKSRLLRLYFFQSFYLFLTYVNMLDLGVHLARKKLFLDRCNSLLKFNVCYTLSSWSVFFT